MNNSGDNRCWRGCGETGTLLYCWWECKLVQPLWKRAWKFFKKLKIELTYGPAIAPLCIYPKDTKITDLKGCMHPNVYSSTINNSQIMERSQMSISWRMDKEDVVYIYNGMLLGNEKEWNLAVCSNMDGTGGYCAKWNKSEKDRYVFTHMWNLRNIRPQGKGRKKDKNSGRRTLRDS